MNTPPKMTDADREAVLRGLPDMLDGFLKTWGWLHFAKGIEAARDAQWASHVAGLDRAIMHYENALTYAFPLGAQGKVYEHWNKAREAIAQRGKEKA